MVIGLSFLGSKESLVTFLRTRPRAVDLPIGMVTSWPGERGWSEE